MAKRAKTVADERGDAENLDEAADIKLKAARKLAQARQILREEGLESPDGPPDMAPDPEPDPDPSYIEPNPIGVPDPTEEKLSRILSTLEGAGKFEVSKHGPGGTKARVGVYNIEDWDDGAFLERMAHEHKGGTFTVVFKDRLGRIRGQDTLTFDPISYGKPAPAASSEGGSMERLLAIMESRDARYQQEMSAMRLDNQRMMLEMVKSLSQGGSGGVLKTSSDVVAIAELFRKKDETSSPMSQLRETVELLHALKEENPMGEPPSPLNAAIDKAFLLLTPLLGVWAKKLSGQEGLPPEGSPGASPAAPALGHTQGMPPAPAPGGALPAPGDAQASIDPRIAAYAMQLLAAAEQRARPEAIAGFIVDSVPEEGLSELYDMVSDPGLISGMQTAEPKLKVHSGWLVALVREMKVRLEDVEPEAAPEQAAAPASGGSAPALAEAAPGGNGTKPAEVEALKP